MDIKINCKVLKEQIQLCDSCADMFKINTLKEIFGGIAELLSTICYALEEGKEINFIKEN